jgi:hypothetical protein
MTPSGGAPLDAWGRRRVGRRDGRSSATALERGSKVTPSAVEHAARAPGILLRPLAPCSKRAARDDRPGIAGLRRGRPGHAHDERGTQMRSRWGDERGAVALEDPRPPRNGPTWAGDVPDFDTIPRLTWTFPRSPNGIRTRVSTLRGWCPWPLDDGAVARTPATGTPRTQPTRLPASPPRRATPRDEAASPRQKALVEPWREARARHYAVSSSGGRTRTPNNRARTCRVANYTTPERARPG